MKPHATATMRSVGKRPRGFTLIELMITVAVVGIIVAVAYPSFTQQIAKSRRNDAKTALLNCAQMLERFNTQSGTYTASADTVVNGACTGATKSGYYTMPSGNVPSTVGASTFLIRATPSGAQSSDACGSLTFTQDGTKGVSGGTMTSASCW